MAYKKQLWKNLQDIDQQNSLIENNSLETANKQLQQQQQDLNQRKNSLTYTIQQLSNENKLLKTEINTKASMQQFRQELEKTEQKIEEINKPNNYAQLLPYHYPCNYPMIIEEQNEKTLSNLKFFFNTKNVQKQVKVQRIVKQDVSTIRGMEMFLETARTKYLKDIKQYDQIILLSRRKDLQEKYVQWRLLLLNIVNNQKIKKIKCLSQNENRVRFLWSRKVQFAQNRYIIEEASSEED